MPDLVWSDAFLLGYAPMDERHHAFVRCLADLRAAPAADVERKLEAMLRHLVEHFDEERRWMEETEFPATACHADEHAAVLASAREVLDIVKAEGATDVVDAFCTALAEWFPGHADYMDSALSHWMCKLRFGGKPVVLRRSPAAEAAPVGQARR